MLQTIWTYGVKPERREEFERRYAGNGDWAKLFGRVQGYRGTRLLRDARNPDRYATIDTWETAEALDRFRRDHVRAYEELDRQCAELTIEEHHVGMFETRE